MASSRAAPPAAIAGPSGHQDSQPSQVNAAGAPPENPVESEDGEQLPALVLSGDPLPRVRALVPLPPLKDARPPTGRWSVRSITALFKNKEQKRLHFNKIKYTLCVQASTAALSYLTPIAHEIDDTAKSTERAVRNLIR